MIDLTGMLKASRGSVDGDRPFVYKDFLVHHLADL